MYVRSEYRVIPRHRRQSQDSMRISSTHRSRRSREFLHDKYKKYIYISPVTHHSKPVTRDTYICYICFIGYEDIVISAKHANENKPV